MDRRSFIRGTLISVTAAAESTALVRLASAGEAQCLTPNRAVLLGYPEPESFFSYESPEVYTRLNNGAFVCIGIMTRLEIEQRVDESLTWNGEVQLMPGLKRGQLFFERQR
jgi:hypothetical protein